jgi:hypothetical protein
MLRVWMGGVPSRRASAILRFAKRWRVLLGFAAIYLYAFPYFGGLRSANELPRILTTIQLADRGSFCIDERMNDLGSVADISTTPSGHHYQNKAPGLSILGLAVYFPVSAIFRAVGRPPSLIVTTWLLRVFVVTAASLAFLPLLGVLLARFARSENARNGALVAYALGSMAFPYGLLFMSHVPAAAAVGTAFALAIPIARREARCPEKAAAAVGALLGLSMLLEYQAVLGAMILGGYAVLGSEKRVRVALVIASAAAPFLLALATYHASAFGSPFRTGYAYAVDPANHVGLMGIVGFSSASLSQLFLDPDNGILLLSPWVLVSIVGAVAIALDAEARARVGAEALVAVLIIIVYLVFVASLAVEFGRAGWSVGPRYIAVAMPFLAMLAAAGLEFCARHDALRVPAYALVMIGVGVHVLAATTYPHWPVAFANPLFEVAIRSIREGHAPHSLGTLVGLRGLASLAPLYLAVVVLALALLATTRRLVLEMALAALLATFAVSRYERLAVSSRSVAEPEWAFIESTFEP